MAKKKNAETFKAKAVSNFPQIASEFDRLETFIEDSNDIPETAKNEIKKTVKGYRDRTNAKQNQISNVAYFNSAVNITNQFIESLTE